MTIRVGVGGWTYEPWRGVFYPDGLTQKRELEYAAQHLTAIEINATFYGRQKPESYRKWAEVAPDGFKFSLKASQYATARKVLAEGGESIAKFLEQGFTELGDKLGPINWQFRATKQFDRDDFARFLDLIPDKQDGLPLHHVLEPRHESFRDPKFFALARARNMAVVTAESGEYACLMSRPPTFRTPGSSAASKSSRTAIRPKRSTDGPTRRATGQRAGETCSSISSRARKCATPRRRRRSSSASRSNQAACGFISS